MSLFQEFTTGESVTAVFLGLLGRAPKQEGLDYYTALIDDVDNGYGIAEMLAELVTVQPEWVSVTTDQTRAQTVDMLFNNLFDRDPTYDEAGSNYWVDGDGAAVPVDQMVLALIEGAAAKDQLALADAVDVAAAGIGAGVDGESFLLVETRDLLDGTAGNDLFEADIIQNIEGLQVNTLGTGDRLDGGAGYDKMYAQLTSAGSAGNDGSNMAIQPRTTSIEEVKVEALNNDQSNPGYNGYEYTNYEGQQNTNVYLSAKNMTGIDTIGSWYSDADLTIQSLTTVQDNGSYGRVSDMTVVMGYTGNNDGVWDESDLTVLFDQDYLTTTAIRTDNTVFYNLMNEDGYDVNAAEPLNGVVIARLEFELNGTSYDFADYLVEDKSGNGDEIKTYAELLSALDVALAEMKAANPGDAELQTVTVNLGGPFEADVNPDTLDVRVGTQVELTVPGFQEDGTTENVLEVSPFFAELDPAEGEGSVENSNRFERADGDIGTEIQELRINVDLEKVGLVGQGGDLIIGSMIKQAEGDYIYNYWEGDSAGKGIQIFDVTVFGGDDKPSNLNSLRSTNNNLEEVYIDTDANQSETYADLSIGFGGEDESGLKDVRIIDSTAFKGNLTLDIELSDEIADKYLDLYDTQANPAADNVDFVYTTGMGNDSLFVELDADNYEAEGEATREDFSLDIQTNDGMDYVFLEFDGEDSSSARVDSVTGEEENLAHWYYNQKLLQNVSISTGNDNDTVHTYGSGDVIIDLGAGDDTVYADNSGSKASWSFNALGGGINDLHSDANDMYRIYDGKLTVSFLGYESTVDLPETDGTVTDLQVNQAIKDAINNNATLNKLISAHDGPANTLVVHALVDNVLVDGSILYVNNLDPVDVLSVSLTAPTSLSASEVNTLNNQYGTGGLTEAGLISLMNDSIDDFDAKGDYEDTLHSSGSINPYSVSDNTITPNTGDDVVVLGVGMFSNDTVVYQGFGNGTDTIVYFDTTDETFVLSNPSANVRETVTITFSDLDTTDGTADVTFDGDTVELNDTVNGLIPAADVAFYFYNDFSGTDWDVISWDEGTGTVTLEYVAAFGDQTDLVPGDFVFSGGTGSVSIDSIVDGDVGYSAATATTFTVEFDGTIVAADGTIDLSELDGELATEGTVISVDDGDGPVTLADKVASASYDDWTAVLTGGPGSTNVTFTANDGGAFVAPDDDGIDSEAELEAIFTDGANGVDADVTGPVEGSDQIGTISLVTVDSADGLDYLDFSAYNVVGVDVDGQNFISTAAVGENYVLMTENPLNAGEYLMELYTEAGAADTLLGVIGTADFGYTLDFVEDNFII